jgi:hypothetical protein
MTKLDLGRFFECCGESSPPDWNSNGMAGVATRVDGQLAACDVLPSQAISLIQTAEVYK